MPRVVFDTELRRPACAILQAVFGGTPGIANRFPSDRWLITPTPHMGCYEATEEEVDLLVALVESQR